MKQILFGLTILLASVPLYADTVRIEPPAPDTQSFIRVHASGIWPSGCVPAVRDVTRAGSRIEAALESPGQICTTVLTPWSATADVGLLPAGVYDLVVTVKVQASPPTEMARLTLIVRDRAAFSVVPAATSAVTPTAVELRRGSAWPPQTKVFFGGVEVPATDAGTGRLRVTPPPHAPGTVDVEVSAGGAQRERAAAAFTWFDPAAPPDPMLFEPLLFPIDFEGPGAFGSRWTTENVVSSAFGAVWFRDQLPLAGCRTCPPVLEGRSALRVGSTAGRLLYVVRGSDPLYVSSRIRDLSRNAQTAGTAIPVVRESDFRRGETWIVDVPADEHSRGVLRIYSHGDRPVQVAINVHREKGTVVFRAATLTRASDDAPLSATVDLGSLGLTAGERVDIRLRTGDVNTPLWAMVSITNNDTQQVTIVAPR